MRQAVEPDILTVEETLDKLTVDNLKPLARLLCNKPPARKGELIQLIARTLKDPKQLQELYEKLDATGKAAVQEAVHALEGVLDLRRFRAKYGADPDFGTTDSWSRRSKDTLLSLFFPRETVLPCDLHRMLEKFVPEPAPLQVVTLDELPAHAKPLHLQTDRYQRRSDAAEVELRVRPTARAALQNFQAVMRLIDAGSVSVSDKTRRPTQAAMKAIAAILLDGDFYADDEGSDESWNPAGDLTMQPFAWPLLLQAAGLAHLHGSKLQLSAAGKKALTRPAHEGIRLTWEKWLKSNLLDEFSRISAIKGQQSKGKGGLTAVVPRRQAVVEVLADCPARNWIAIEEVFRVIAAAAEDLVISRDPWKLYLCEQQYGSLGYDGHFTWELLQGRYVLALLFEYAATLGLLDVAYISPEGARDDFYDRWGADDFSCLSRYDGLMYIRINSLGAWCLGQMEHYEPEAITVRPVLKVLPNLDVVAGDERLSPADILFLDRFTERQSDAVWRLHKGKVLQAVEEGLTVAELRDFLRSRAAEPLPQTATVFLEDLEAKASLLEDLGAARWIACKDAALAQLIANDRRLRNLCVVAGDCRVVFRSADEAAVRKGLKELGYVLPRLG